MSKVFAFIFARGGSKGLPNKNILKFAGKPLIEHSIEVAKKVPSINKIFVSTDSKKIIEIAHTSGVNVIVRPKELCGDNSPEWLSWIHAVKYAQKKFGNFSTFLSLPATSPLKTNVDVTNCLKLFTTKTDVVITMTKSSRSPWFNMVKFNPDRSLSLLSTKSSKIVRRQDAPISFDIATVAYVTSPNYILNNENIWNGKVFGVEIPTERAIDIDTKLDFEFAEFLYSKRDL